MFWMGRNLKPNKSLFGAESQFAYDVYQQVPGCLDRDFVKSIPCSYGHLSVISTYNPIYRMYNPIYNHL